MRIAERYFYRANGDAATRTSKTKFWRYPGAALLGLAVVLACSANAAAQQTIWPSTIVPATIDNGPDGPLELGVSFKADTSGTITGIRFYKSAANTGLHTGHLWSRTGALLATVTFTGESASGWQQASFSSPVAIAVNTVYVASYQSSNGHWSVNWNYFATSGVNNPPLHALQNGSGTPDGVWGTAGAFPTHTNASNYWVDVIFNSAAGVAPSITVQPASQTVTAGQTATFSVAATGAAPLTYQWKKNNAAISGANSSSYTTTTTSSDTGAQFSVTISNSVGTVTSKAATLTVNVPPSIAAQPTSQTVTGGQTATFAVMASGTAPLTYQWQKNGTAIGGATSASYTTPATTTSDNGAQFTVVVSNLVGGVTSNAATLTVTAVAPSITTQPVSQSVTVGQTATFSVSATGTALVSYQWQKDGAAIGGSNAASYTTPATTIADNGAQFTVAVSNTAGNVTSSAASLSVNALLPTAAYAFNEGSGNITADASGNGNTGTLSGPSWTRAGHYGNAISFDGANGSVEAANSNSFNPGTAATFSAWVNVLAANADISSVINKWSQTIDDEYLFGLNSNNHLTFAWQTTGGNVWGQPSYYMVSGNTQVPLSTWTYITVVRNGPTISFYVNGNLDATFGAAADANPFRSGINTVRIGGQNRGSVSRVLNGTIDEVRIYNQALTQAQIQADINTPISTPTAPPSITTQPVSQTVTAGQTATFSVTAAGTAPFRYQWQKSGTAISGANSASYTTPATSTSDNGTQFTVVVSNSAGSVTSNTATLTVNAITVVAPSITTQPISQTISAGQTATFSVTTSGTAPLGYQWQRNGAAISGANSASYTTQATTTADNGAQFAAVVNNSAGSVTSSAATLTVNAATYLLSASPTSLSFGNVDIGSSGSLNTIVTNNGNSNVTISVVTVTGTGFSASGVTSGTILAPNQSATLSVAFAPTVAQSVTGSVTMSSNATNSPAKVDLGGVGIQTASAAFPVWVAPSLVRVGKADAAGTASSISLSSARGETVDTQVILQGPAGGLTNVNVSASALTGPGGASIPASSVTLYREYYITVTGTANYGGGSNPPLGSGTYTEPLIPFNDPETGSPLCGTTAALKACNAAISAGQNQPYWIDISVLHGATNSPPGTYTGSISITAAQGNVTIPVTLTVWNFELPAQPSELSLWTLWPPAAGNTTTTLAQALMRNKVIGWYDVAANASSDVTNFGLNRSGLDGYYFIGIQCNGSYSSIPSTSQINTAAANFPAGLGLDFYLADELNGCTSDYTAIKTMGTNAHAANRSVKTMMTINATDSNLYGAIDHWVLLDSLQQWPALPFTNGDLWSYTSCNAGFGNTPEWMVDYPPINERIQAGFLNWTQGATGILYYRSDGWTAGNAIGSWNNVDTTACGGGLGRPGDGIFLYPPGPIASSESAPGIRLKAIRDGIQDYEYAQILKNLGQVPFVNSIIVPIATSWSNWSHDPNALENARLQLGQQLHLLAP